ncbi:MAG: hypothetical protein WCV85_04625 [Patescibacteria group bacterium]|jgi:hypothetical protein
MSDNMLGRIVRKLAQLPAEMFGSLFDLLEKLSGSSGRMWLFALNKFLRGEQPWGIPPTFTITTNGRSGEQCITDLKKNSFSLEGAAWQLLSDKDFVTTNGVTYKLALIMGDEFIDIGRTDKNIRTEAYQRGYVDPPVELGAYLREMYADEDLEKMGLWSLILMHKPILNSLGGLFILGISRARAGRLLCAFKGHTACHWDRNNGFVFLVPTSN